MLCRSHWKAARAWPGDAQPNPLPRPLAPIIARHVNHPATQYIANTARRALSLFWLLAKIIVPVMIAVRVGEAIGLVELLGTLLGPLMVPLNLPPETGIVWLACVLIGPPAGLAALAGLDASLTVGQASTLAAMMLIAHALPLECWIVAKAGGSFRWSFLSRAVGSFLYGLLVATLLGATGWLSEPADLSALAAPADASLGAWVIASLELLATVGIVLIVLLVLLDAMEKVGLTALVTRAMTPILAASGMDMARAGERTAPLVTVGALLGLTYGAGLIIEESERGTIPPSERNIALAWVSLSHSLIEDTALMLLIDADLWVILAGRIVFTIVVVRLLAPTIRRRSAVVA